MAPLGDPVKKIELQIARSLRRSLCINVDDGDCSMKKQSRKLLPVVYPNSAGIDIAKDCHAVALPANGAGEQPVRMFGGLTRDLEEIASWLAANSIEQVALEATGVYWISVYEMLDARGFEVWLVNPTGLQRPDRRKSDVLDCQWIQQLMSLGMLKRSHRPADAICELRSYVRNRRRAISDRARCVQHMQKALQQMNLKLDSVLSDIAGQTGCRLLRRLWPVSEMARSWRSFVTVGSRRAGR